MVVWFVSVLILFRCRLSVICVCRFLCVGVRFSVIVCCRICLRIWLWFVFMCFCWVRL